MNIPSKLNNFLKVLLPKIFVNSTWARQEVRTRVLIMMSSLLRLTLFLVVLNQLLSPCEAYGSSGGKGYNDPMRSQAFMGTSAGIPGHTPTRRGLGISAWGIVVVILALILGGMGFYYFSMCYPILCKKERNYDMIQLHTVAV